VPHSSPFCVVTLLGSKDINWGTNKKPNSFTNPPQFAFSPNLNFLVLPRLAFISGRIALIFQNRFAFTSFLVYFSIIIYSQRDPSGDFYIGVNVRAHRAAGTDAGEAGFLYRLSLLYLF